MNSFAKLFPLFLLLVFACSLPAQTNNAGDKKIAKLKYQKALKSYLKILKKNPADSVRIQEKVAECYAVLNDASSAEAWYKKAIQNGSKKAEIKFALAQQLLKSGNYEEARKVLMQYKKQNPTDVSVDDMLMGLDNLKELSRDRGVYQIEAIPSNSKKSEISGTFLNSNTAFVSSSCKCNMPTADWKTRSFYQLQTVQDSAARKKVKGLKARGFKGINSVTFSPVTNEVIFAASKVVKTNFGKRIELKLFSSPFPAKGKKNIVELPFNSDTFSNAHPAISRDGNTLYFVSDRKGGFGGSDIYLAKKVNGKWSEPQNLGKEVNTPHNEVYPFIATDGTLYFSSDGLDGLGGYDIYKTAFDGKKWKRPENLATPINSNFDDFAFVIDSANQKGFFTSNRSGGKGSDDVFSFNFDPSKLDYKILVKVREAGSKQPLQNAKATLSCKADANKFSADAMGEIRVVVKSSNKCKLDVSAPGYKTFSREVSRANAGVLEVELSPDAVLLNVTVKEKESGLPLRDVSLSLKDAQNNVVTFVTGMMGTFDTQISAGDYTVFSTDYKTLNDNFSTKDAADVVLKKEYVLSKKDFTVSVPLLANCFSSLVTVTDLATGEKTLVKPDLNGEVRLELKLNNHYVIEHNLRKDTISTSGLFPGDEIEGPCKFKVGQKWIVSNVFYDLNKATIRKDAAEQLDNLVRIMNEHPSLQIELASHTDCRGTAKFNDALSLNRAKAAIDYIVGKGVKLKRLVAAGFGERKPVNDCKCEPTNNSPCTEEQHQANRRTEVKVLKY